MSRGSYCMFCVLCFSLAATSVLGISYPAVNAANFPSGVYNNGNAISMPYRYFRPVTYDPEQPSSILYPLVLFLHGAGEKGNNNSNQLGNNANGAMIFISSDAPNNQAEYPCFWVAPQLAGSHGNWGVNYVPGQLNGIIQHFIDNYPIDPDRIYITGISLGGGGTWKMLVNYPNRFAAAAPICGWGSDNEGVAHVPTWTFHSAGDTVVDISTTDSAVERSKAKSLDLIYTRYATGGHSSSWNRAYHPNTPLVEWMMTHQRGSSNQSKILSIETATPTTEQWVASGTDVVQFSGVINTAASAFTAFTWSNGTQSGSIITSGTTGWESGPIELNSGVNTIRFHATVGTFATSGGGNTTLWRTVKVVRREEADNVPPQISISNPTTRPTYVGTGSSVTLKGTASDNADFISTVSWQNNRGGHGFASGTKSWAIGGIDLYPGENIISVSVQDIDGNTATTNLTIGWHPFGWPPTLINGLIPTEGNNGMEIVFRWRNGQHNIGWMIEQSADLISEWETSDILDTEIVPDPSDSDFAIVRARLPDQALVSGSSFFRIVSFVK